VNIRRKKIPVVPVPNWPYFFLPTLLFFQRDWLCNPIFSRWLRAAHTACQNGVCCHTHTNYWTKLPKFVHRKYASLVNIDVGTVLQIAKQKNAKPWKKYSKKIYFRPTDPNFFTIWNRNHRYFFYALLWYTYHIRVSYVKIYASSTVHYCNCHAIIRSLTPIYQWLWVFSHQYTNKFCNLMYARDIRREVYGIAPWSGNREPWLDSWAENWAEKLIPQKFNSIKYIENIKIVPPISRLCNTNFPQWQGTLRAELRADSWNISYFLYM
jgi:hypothetical protein